MFLFGVLSLGRERSTPVDKTARKIFMPRRFGTLMSVILDAIDLDFPLFPLEDPYRFARRKRQNKLERKRYLEALWRMQRAGYLKIVENNKQKFIKLTGKGQLEKLLQKTRIDRSADWDGKWRVLVFDIPEDFHLKRDSFRALLKRNGFKKLQGSVFVSPYPLNREAIRYLKDSGLKMFIRIMKVEEMDDDSDLREKFGVLKSRPREKHTEKD